AVRAEGNPYLGLRPFEAGDAGLYFGREPDVRAVVERLRGESMVLVAGDSGVGKSSLCRAGVIPEVLGGALDPARAWRATIAVPGARPLRALAVALSGHLEQTADALQAEIAEAPQALGRRVAAILGRGRGLLLFVDQLEELVAVSRPEEAEIVA